MEHMKERSRGSFDPRAAEVSAEFEKRLQEAKSKGEKCFHCGGELDSLNYKMALFKKDEITPFTLTFHTFPVCKKHRREFLTDEENQEEMLALTKDELCKLL